MEQHEHHHRQPLKKRKLEDPTPQVPLTPPPPPPPPQNHYPPPPPPPPVEGPPTPPPLSQEEVLHRRRNQEEIRNLYQIYRTIKRCSSKDNAHRSPDVEQAYLSLITASRGCTSAQRIVSELIPRYASYCPTALEAATQVVINMHNWSLSLVARGEDADGVAFETAKNCILGLYEICFSASLEAPTSSVIEGICSVVFIKILSFFISCFDGKDILEIIDKETLKMKYTPELFPQLKQYILEEDGSLLLKLLKLKALSFLRIFFSCPKNVLSAWFELLTAPSTDGVCREGRYLLRQLSSTFDFVEEINKHSGELDKTSDENTTCTSAKEADTGGEEKKHKMKVLDGDHNSMDASDSPRMCLLRLVLEKFPSLSKWFFSRCKSVCSSAPSHIVSDIIAVLQQIVDSLADLVEVEHNKEDGEDIIRECSGTVADSPRKSSYASGRDWRFQVNQSLESDRHSNTSSNHESGSVDFGDRIQGDSRYSFPKDPPTNPLLSPHSTKVLDTRNDSHESLNWSTQDKRTQASGVNVVRYPSGLVNNLVTRNHLSVPHTTGANQLPCYSDGDPEAMDVFSATRKLWLGFLPPHASETSVRFHVERYGPLESFSFFPVKRFAVVEYRSVMDAIKARGSMCGHSPFGTALDVKFYNAELGTRGSLNGVAIGYSCDVYVGNVLNQWMKYEILREVRKVVKKGPCAVTELSGEGAVLLEFETYEEAATVIGCLRQYRNGEASFKSSFASGPETPTSRLSFGGSVSGPFGHISEHMPNSVLGSPNSQTPASQVERMRISHLSSLLLSLRKRCNISEGSNHFDNHHGIMKDEDILPTSTVLITVPNVGAPCITDDELIAICNIAIGNTCSVLRLSQDSAQMGRWFVECSNIDAALTLSRNLRTCPASFFHIEFSGYHGRHKSESKLKSDHAPLEFPSPRAHIDQQAAAVQNGHAGTLAHPASGWVTSSEVGSYNFNGYPDCGIAGSSQGGAVSGPSGQMWMPPKAEPEAHSILGCAPFTVHMTATGPPTVPPRHPQQSPYRTPFYPPSSSSWNAHNLNHRQPINTTPGVMPCSLHPSVIPPPFLPASVTPLAQLQGHGVQPSYSQIVPSPIAPPALAFMQPPRPEMPPPLPPSPPRIPPPPASPPPPLPPSDAEASNLQNSRCSMQSQWQGRLLKSGVHYCRIYARKMDSDICRYSIAIPEPTEWPSKLDINNRTDFRHVKSAFTSAPPHRREVCQLLPSSAADHKGFQDFVSYLNHREYAGVIKLSATKSMWPRTLFILPYSPEACSLLSVKPNPTDCLIALVLPRETNSEWA